MPIVVSIPIYVHAETKDDAVWFMLRHANDAGMVIKNYRVYALGFEVTQEHINQADHGMAIILDVSVGGWYRIVANFHNA